MVAQHTGTGVLDIAGGGEEYDGLGRREFEEMVDRAYAGGRRSSVR